MLTLIISFIIRYPTAPLAIALCLLLLYTIYLHYKIKKFTRGESGASLESTIKKCLASVEEIEKRNELLSEHALGLETRIQECVRNIAVTRFKAFEIGASNQSFSISLLNEKGDGAVISSLHNRDRVTIFAKPIQKYTSTYELTEEEQSVISESKGAHKKK
ncbi:MAG: DUF4446 family protein [Candidatus Pacebacteria bacterium]|nr:DUF4446 family protein [Candidatus Paceibacterota bacterium]